MIIRKTRYKDLDDIFNIIHKVFPEDAHLVCRYIQEIYHRIKDYSIVVYNERVIGFSISTIDNSKGHVLYLAVDPEYRGKGIGSALLCATIMMLFNIYNVDEIYLEVKTTNFAAISLYLKYGFNIVKRIPRYYIDGSDCYVMSLSKTDFYNRSINEKCINRLVNNYDLHEICRTFS